MSTFPSGDTDDTTTTPDKPDTPAPQTPGGPPPRSLGATFAALSMPVRIGIGIAVLLLIGGASYMVTQLNGSASTHRGTQQLDAQAPQSTNPNPNPNGIQVPAPDATGRIIEHEGLAVNRDQGDVTQLVLDPGTYIKINELWSRADNDGKVLLPPGMTRDQAVFFKSEDQQTPYTGEVTEQMAPATSISFEGELNEGYSLSPGVVVWYTNESFQTDPAWILIPKGNPGEHTLFVDSVPVELAIP
ncbi:hypothetical protein [Stomatohabitans albus]|uniref:hypothetical protein n=1 Tax=Stomatohabitans albus TaxID=3110766 RepID=UPI00300D29A8